MSDSRTIAPALDPVDLLTALGGAVPNGFATLIDAHGASAHPMHLQTQNDPLLDWLDQTDFHHPVTKMSAPDPLRTILAGNADTPTRVGFLNDRGGERQLTVHSVPIPNSDLRLIFGDTGPMHHPDVRLHTNATQDDVTHSLGSTLGAQGLLLSALERCALPDPARQHLADLQALSDRAYDQLNTFAHRADPVPLDHGPVDAAKVLVRVCETYKRVLPGALRLTTALTGSAMTQGASAPELETLSLRLLGVFREALVPQGAGTIDVELGRTADHVDVVITGRSDSWAEPAIVLPSEVDAEVARLGGTLTTSRQPNSVTMILRLPRAAGPGLSAPAPGNDSLTGYRVALALPDGPYADQLATFLTAQGATVTDDPDPHAAFTPALMTDVVLTATNMADGTPLADILDGLDPELPGPRPIVLVAAGDGCANLSDRAMVLPAPINPTILVNAIRLRPPRA